MVEEPCLPQSLHIYKPKTEVEYEKCFYQSDNWKTFNQVIYGQCMNANGPDGCCLEGFYKPGICPNLGHLCCIKPDPDCSNLRNNKDITRQMLQQRKDHFKKLVRHDVDASELKKLSFPIMEHERRVRSIRSMGRQIRVNFEVIEMPAHMQLDAITFVTDSLERHNGDTDEMAYDLCQMLDNKYPETGNWACFVGTKFGYSVEAATGKYMLFYIGTVNRIQVMAFVSKMPDLENQ